MKLNIFVEEIWKRRIRVDLEIACQKSKHKLDWIASKQTGP